MKTSSLKLRIYRNHLFKGLVVLLATLCTIPLFLITYFLFQMGISSISLSFLTHLPKPVGEPGGGILNAIAGSVMIVFLSSVFAVPFGIAGGIALAEFKDTAITYWGRLCTEILQGTPSIVIGIIAYIWIVKPMGQFSAFSGSMALAIMMLPLIIRSTEETLKLIPSGLREASLALGVPYYKTILKIVLPSAASGILTGVILSTGRIIGETAPLLFTAFGNPHLEWNIFKPVSSLPMLVYNYAASPYEEWHKQAWGASLVLLAWVIAINLLSKLLAMKWKVKF